MIDPKSAKTIWPAQAPSYMKDCDLCADKLEMAKAQRRRLLVAQDWFNEVFMGPDGKKYAREVKHWHIVQVLPKGQQGALEAVPRKRLLQRWEPEFELFYPPPND